MATEPDGPRPTDTPWKHESTPALEQDVDVDVATNVIVAALAKHLLVHARLVDRIIEVVGLRRSAPPDVGGKLHDARGLHMTRVVHVVRNGDRSRVGPQAPRMGGHDRQVYEGQRQLALRHTGPPSGGRWRRIDVGWHRFCKPTRCPLGDMTRRDVGAHAHVRALRWLARTHVFEARTLRENA